MARSQNGENGEINVNINVRVIHTLLVTASNAEASNTAEVANNSDAGAGDSVGAAGVDNDNEGMHGPSIQY